MRDPQMTAVQAANAQRTTASTVPKVARVLDIVNLSDLEPLAEAALDPMAWAYYSGGAADEVTLRDNVAAWSRHRFRPRVLLDVAAVDPSTTLLGTPVALPVGVAPTALHGLADPEGEVAMARAAARVGALYCMSSLASRPMEDLAGVDGHRWFQLYAHREREITADLVRRAEEAGFLAVVVTVDLPVIGRREREVRGGFAWPSALGYGNFARYAEGGDVPGVTGGLHTSQLTWPDLTWLRGLTSLPLVLKGVLTAEDAVLGVEHGADAIWVSNHGGRQLDRTPAGIDVLDEVVHAVGDGAEVYVDGGVRRGTDALSAIALGARAVFAGRPWLFALAAGGSDGVVDAYGIFRAELETAMALLGVRSIGEVTRSHVC